MYVTKILTLDRHENHLLGYAVKPLNIMLIHREFDFMHTKQNKLANEISQMPTI